MFKLQVNIDAKRANEAVKALRQAADELEKKLLERMKEMQGENWSPKWGEDPLKLMTLEAFPAMEVPLAFVGVSPAEQQGNLPDYSIHTIVEGGPIFYRVMGVLPDGREIVLGDGYPSRGYAHASFDKHYDSLDVDGCTLKQYYIALVLRDNDGREYRRKGWQVVTEGSK